MNKILTVANVAGLMNGPSGARVGVNVPSVPGVQIDLTWARDRQVLRASIFPQWKDLAAVWPMHQRTYAVPHGCLPEVAFTRIGRVVRDRVDRWSDVARIEALARQWCQYVGAGEVNRVLCALDAGGGAPPWPQDYARMTAAHRAGWTAWYRQRIQDARVRVAVQGEDRS